MFVEKTTDQTVCDVGSHSKARSLKCALCLSCSGESSVICSEKPIL